MTSTLAPAAPTAPVLPVLTTAVAAPRTATVILFKPSGRYYTTESWRVPEGAYAAFQMSDSPDFHQIDGGMVLVDTDAGEEFPNDENFGVPHILVGPAAGRAR